MPRPLPTSGRWRRCPPRSLRPRTPACARSTCSMPCSSFRQGMITVIVCPLYIEPSEPSFSCAGASRYHGSHEAASVSSPRFGRCCCCAAGPFRRALGIHAAHGARPRPVPRQPPHHDHVFQVVTDPKHADAIFSDRIGEALRDAAGQRCFRRPNPPSRSKPSPKRTTRPDWPKAHHRHATTSSTIPPLNSAIRPRQGHDLPGGPEVQPGACGPRTSSPRRASEDLDRIADRIVSRLKKDLASRGR